LPEVLLLNLIIFTGALVQGLIGFGLGVVCSSVIFLISPSYLPVPLIMLSLILTATIVALNRAELSVALVKWPLVGQTAGTILAAGVVAWLDRSWFGFVFALLLLLAVFLTLLRVRVPINPISGSTCGFISGFSGTIVAIGGPPMALLYHSLPPKVVLTNLSTYFLVGCMISLLALGVVGRVSWHDVELTLKLTPGLFLGYFVSRYLVAYSRPPIIKSLALGLSGGVGVYSLVKYGSELLARYA